jgi:hypothetical protein
MQDGRIYQVEAYQQPEILGECWAGLSVMVRKKAEAGEEPEPFYALCHNIKNFDWKWGHEYTIRVAVEPVDEPDEDGPDQEISCTEILQDNVVSPGRQFQVRIPHAVTYNGWRALFKAKGLLRKSYFLADRECKAANNNVKVAVDARLKGKEDFSLVMSFGDLPEQDPLIIHSVSD